MMICSKCGQENEDGSKFCVFCGQSFVDEETPEKGTEMSDPAADKEGTAGAGSAFTKGDPAAVEHHSRPVEELYRSPYIKSNRDPVRERQYRIRILVCILVIIVALAAIIVIFLNEADRKKRAQELSQPPVMQETTVTEEAPAQEAPAQEAPAQETPAQETPAQEAPAQETPAQEAPAQEAPAQETPAQETPVQEAPAQEVTDQATEEDLQIA